METLSATQILGCAFLVGGCTALFAMLDGAEPITIRKILGRFGIRGATAVSVVSLIYETLGTATLVTRAFGLASLVGAGAIKAEEIAARFLGIVSKLLTTLRNDDRS